LYDKKIPVCQAKYQLPIWRGIDDLKDDMADILEVQNGMSTLAAKLEERHVTFEEIMSDRERIKELGLDNLLYPNGQAMAQTSNTQANSNSSSN
jgi:capsid protein